MKTILRLAQTKESLNVVDDQVGAPTSAPFLAKHAYEMIRILQSGREDLCGIYHLVPDGEVSWCGFARWIVQNAKNFGAELRLEPTSIRSISTEKYPTAAIRPLNSRLSNAKIKSVLGTESFQSWDQEASDVLYKLVF